MWLNCACCYAGHPGWSIWGMESEAFLQDWKERPDRVHIVAPLPATTHALSSNMLYQPQPQGMFKPLICPVKTP